MLIILSLSRFDSCSENCEGNTPCRCDISDDITPTVPVIKHAIKFCEKELNWSIVNVCCVYACAPFLLKSDLELGLKLLKETQKDYVFPITEFSSSIYRSFKVNKYNHIEPIFPENILERTQNFDQSYYDVGQFYWGKKKSWLTNERIHSSSEGIIIPQWRALDIDTLLDFTIAKFLMEKMS